MKALTYLLIYNLANLKSCKVDESIQIYLFSTRIDFYQEDG